LVVDPGPQPLGLDRVAEADPDRGARLCVQHDPALSLAEPRSELVPRELPRRMAVDRKALAGIRSLTRRPGSPPNAPASSSPSQPPRSERTASFSDVPLERREMPTVGSVTSGRISSGIAVTEDEKTLRKHRDSLFEAAGVAYRLVTAETWEDLDAARARTLTDEGLARVRQEHIETGEDPACASTELMNTRSRTRP
jgi:hypothetical protein